MQDSDYAKTILDVIPPTMRYIKNEMRNSAKSELTVPQFRLLAKLSRSLATNNELAEWMGVSAPTMTRMVDSLVKRNLIKRTSEPADRRQVKLSLTDGGQTLYQKIHRAVHAKFTEKVAYLTAEKKKALTNGLNVLRELFL